MRIFVVWKAVFAAASTCWTGFTSQYCLCGERGSRNNGFAGISMAQSFSFVEMCCQKYHLATFTCSDKWHSSDNITIGCPKIPLKEWGVPMRSLVYLRFHIVYEDGQS